MASSRRTTRCHPSSVAVSAVAFYLTIVKAVQITAVFKEPTLSMLSRSQEYHLVAGTQISLDCEFYMESFHFFDNPTIWMKSQGAERTTINLMVMIQEPFSSTGRFDVSLIRHQPRFRLVLKIKDLTQEDSGNYTCEVRKKQVVLDTVTHSVYVMTPVSLVRLSWGQAALEAAAAGATGGLHPGLLNATSGDVVPIECVVIGGYPVPSVDVFLNNRNITDQFQIRRHYNVSGEPGFRQIDVTTARWTRTFLMHANQDRQTIQCSARVHRLEPVSDQVKLNILYRPVITCSPKYIPLDHVHICVRCTVTSRPEPSSVFWDFVPNMTTSSSSSASPSSSFSASSSASAAATSASTAATVADEEAFPIDLQNEQGTPGEIEGSNADASSSSSQNNRGYWSSIRDLGNGVLESSLCMRTTGDEASRVYTIVAENKLGQITKNVRLLMEYKPFKETPAHSSDGAIGRHDRHSPRTIPKSPGETATRRPSPEGGGGINIGSYLDRPLQQPHNTRDVSVFGSRPSSSVHSGAGSLLRRHWLLQPLHLLSASGPILILFLPAVALLLLLLLLIFSSTCTTYLHSAETTDCVMTLTQQNTQHVQLKKFRLLRSCPTTHATFASVTSSSSSPSTCSSSCSSSFSTCFSSSSSSSPSDLSTCSSSCSSSFSTCFSSSSSSSYSSSFPS